MTDNNIGICANHDVWNRSAAGGLVPLALRSEATRLATAIAGLDNVIIAGHVEPDGDAIGSITIAAIIMAKLGRNYALYCYGGLPDYLRFFPMPAKLYSRIADLPFSPSSAILLDCSDPRRLGPELWPELGNSEIVNVDHHLGSSGLGNIANWIVPQAAATAQLMAYISIALNMDLLDDLGLAVALGVITDTGGLRHGSTTAEIFELCAYLSKNGCDIPALRQKIENCWSLSRMRLWGRLMQRARLEFDGKICFCRVSQTDLKEANASYEDLEGFSEHLRLIRGVQVAVMLREDAPDRCKVSLRSHGNVDVREMAASLGGGGHKNASGINIQEPAYQVEAKLLSVVSGWLRDNSDANT